MMAAAYAHQQEVEHHPCPSAKSSQDFRDPKNEIRLVPFPGSFLSDEVPTAGELKFEAGSREGRKGERAKGSPDPVWLK
jgi:hypothetical protein